MFKQICFFRKRDDMSMEQFIDYYENQHSQLAKRTGKPGIPNALRYPWHPWSARPMSGGRNETRQREKLDGE